MGRHWYYFLFLVWFSYLIVSAILLFTNGFLLNRVVINKNSTCDSFPNEESVSYFNDIPHCSKQQSKVVLIIIDAFRYDFALYNEDLQYPLPYENKMPFISNLITEKPSNNKLYKFIADPPTTTMQRLKALTTGSLPTFIDAGSNFASTEITEDNIINQLVTNERNVVFLGDDTWMSMYPNYFLRSYPYPSFNVWDLDTVDNGVTNNIFEELKRDDWSLLVGHYLGVDHCGHRYGPNHSEMARKLREINIAIKNITEYIDDNTILFVVGDHGMTGTGDHGGESPDEVTAALFVHSKTPLIADIQESVKQVDLIPTLATILGVPIPYANLGTIIPGCLPSLSFDDTNWVKISSAIWANVQQITLYIGDYSSITNTFDSDKIEEFKIEYEMLKADFENKIMDRRKFINNCMTYMLSMREMCEKVWVQFDSFSMTRGLLLCFTPIFFVYILVNYISSSKFFHIISKSLLGFVYGTTAIVAILSAISYYANITSNFLVTTYFFTGILGVSILAFVLIQNWELISLSWYESRKYRRWVDLVCRFVLLFSVCALFSNSFVVQESSVALYLLISLMIIMILDVFTFKISKNINNSIRSKVKVKLLMFIVIFAFLIRVSMFYWRCREEQNCPEIFTQKQSSASRTQLIFSLISIGLVVTFSRMWLRYCGNLAAFTSTILWAQYAPTVITVCCGGFWVLRSFPIGGRSRITPLWQPDTLAILVYSFIAIGLGLTIFKPITVFVIRNRLHTNVQGRSVPEIFQQIRSLFHPKSEKDQESPIVCGLATAYSAPFVIGAVYLLLLLGILLGTTVAPSAVLLLLSVVVVLFISSIVRYEKASNTGDLFQVPGVVILTWTFLPIYFFYGTGHQATFPNIAWEAAFVGTGGNLTNNYIPASLVLINTFGSYIIIGFLLPLIQIAPFSIYAIVTSLCNKKKQEAKDLSGGDMILYENDYALFSNSFVLCCKYICCFGIRIFASMLSATIHCRHLMVWKVFAPKFIFEAIALFITIPSVLAGYVLLIRINSAVNRLIKGLEKGNR